MKTNGLVIEGSEIFRLEVIAVSRPGTGHITISGPITQEFEHVLESTIRCIYLLSELGEFPDPKLDCRDLHLGLRAPSTESPIGGESYGLALFACLTGLFSGTSISDNDAFTGAVSEGGRISPVERISEKRSACPKLGIGRLFIPGCQLDFFCSTVNQCPVDTVFECWSVLHYMQELSSANP